MKYVVIEVQKFENGSMSTPAYAYEDLNQAEAKYHAILASAAVSALPVHSCILISEEAFPLRNECFKHTATVSASESEQA